MTTETEKAASGAHGRGQTNAPPADLPLAGAVWLLIMALLDVVLLGLTAVPLLFRLVGLGLLGLWWWVDARSPRWLPYSWLAVSITGQVAATYFWRMGDAGAAALAGGSLAGFVLLAVAAPLLGHLTREQPIAEPAPAKNSTGVPLPVLQLAAESMNARLLAMMQALDGMSAGSTSPVQAIQLRLLRNEVTSMQALVRQRLGGVTATDADHGPSLARPQNQSNSIITGVIGARAAQVVPNGLSALVVDDDPVGRTLTRLLLEQAGYRVEETDDAKMALEMALMEGPDIALVAARVGRHHGVALAWCIHQGGGPPVVLMRGRGDRVTDRQRRRAGLAAMLGKPVTPDTLMATLAPLVPRRPTPVADVPPAPPPTVPPSTLAPDTGPVLDLHVLEEHLSILGAERVVQIIESFSRNAPITLAAIAEAVAAQDVTAVGRAAHKLASGALTVGLSVVANLAKTADSAAKAGDATTALAAASQLPLAFAAGQVALGTYRRDRLIQISLDRGRSREI